MKGEVLQGQRRGKDPEVSKAFGISSIPTFLFIAAEGNPTVVYNKFTSANLQNHTLQKQKEAIKLQQ